MIDLLNCSSASEPKFFAGDALFGSCTQVILMITYLKSYSHKKIGRRVYIQSIEIYSTMKAILGTYILILLRRLQAKEESQEKYDDSQD